MPKPVASGDIVAFADEDENAIYGQVVEVSGATALLIDTDGHYHQVRTSDLRHKGEPLPDGSVLLPALPTYEIQNGARVPVSQEWEIKKATDALLADSFIRATCNQLAKHLFRHRMGVIGRADTGVPFRRGHYQSWDIPLAMVSSRQLDESGKPNWTLAFERYLCSSETRRMLFEGCLARLKLTAPVQHKLFVACILRGMSQADACRHFGLKSSNVSVQLRKAIHFMESHTGENVPGYRENLTNSEWPGV